MTEIADLVVFFGVATIGGMVVVVGSLLVFGRKVSEPRRELQQRVVSLEKELENLKQ